MFLGTRENIPPEYILNGEYEGPNEAVWTLGLLLYYVVCGDEPFCTFLETTMKPLRVPSFVSTGKSLIAVDNVRLHNDKVVLIKQDIQYIVKILAMLSDDSDSVSQFCIRP